MASQVTGDGARWVSGLRVSDITARLVAGPYRISPTWLTPAGRDAVPFAAASPIAPMVAGRLAAAARACDQALVFCCAVTPSNSAERPVPVQAEGTRIHSAAHALGTPEALIVLPDLSAALLATAWGFAIAAGPHAFAEAIVGSDVRRARARFAEFALAKLGSSPQPLLAAAYYGCALSGRPWRPAWWAWRRAADVPAGSGIGTQLAGMRQIAAGQIGAEEFGRMFRAARRKEMAAGERAAGPLADALDAVCWALDSYIAPAEGRPRAAGDIDSAGLRQAVSAALAAIG